MSVRLKMIDIKKQLLEEMPVSSEVVYFTLSHFNRKHVQRAIRELVAAGDIVREGNLMDMRGYILNINHKPKS